MFTTEEEVELHTRFQRAFLAKGSSVEVAVAASDVALRVVVEFLAQRSPEADEASWPMAEFEVRLASGGENWRQCVERHATPFGLEYECLRDFDTLVRNGTPEADAAFSALYSWDCAAQTNSMSRACGPEDK